MCVAIALQMIFLTLAIALSSELQPTDMDSCIATTTTILIKAYNIKLFI